MYRDVPRKKFEYRLMDIRDESIHSQKSRLSETGEFLTSHLFYGALSRDLINNLGVDGWELVAIDDHICFFKREIP